MLLYAGRFIQFDDSSDSASDRLIAPVGVLAVVVGFGSLVVAFGDASARQWLGVGLVGVAIAVVWFSIIDDGFRFVWDGNDGDLLVWTLLLALVALPVAASGNPRPDAPRDWIFRVVLYLVTLVLVAFSAGIVGGTFEESRCDSGDECDLGGIAAVGLAFWTVLVGLIVCVVGEVAVGVRRRMIASRRELSG